MTQKMALLYPVPTMSPRKIWDGKCHGAMAGGLGLCETESLTPGHALQAEPYSRMTHSLTPSRFIIHTAYSEWLVAILF